MCKRIKDILWPLNIFGKHKRSVAFDLPDNNASVLLNIVWSGERMISEYTRRVVTSAPNQPVETHDYPKRATYTNGDSTSESLWISRGTQGYRKVSTPENKVHFTCTNVTSLVVNGQQLI